MLKFLFALIAVTVIVHMTLYNFTEDLAGISSSIIIILVFLLVSYISLRIYLYFKVESEEEENVEAFKEKRPKTFYNIKEYSKAVKEKYKQRKELRKKKLKKV